MQKLHHINAFLAVLFLTPFPALIHDTRLGADSTDTQTDKNITE